MWISSILNTSIAIKHWRKETKDFKEIPIIISKQIKNTLRERVMIIFFSIFINVVCLCLFITFLFSLMWCVVCDWGCVTSQSHVNTSVTHGSHMNTSVTHGCYMNTSVPHDSHWTPQPHMTVTWTLQSHVNTSVTHGSHMNISITHGSHMNISVQISWIQCIAFLNYHDVSQ